MRPDAVAEWLDASPTRLRRTTLALACGLLVNAPALATPQPTADPAGDPTQLSLEQLLDLDVQSASKFTQKASEAPSSVTVISAEDIRRFGYRTLADVLNSVRGLYVHNDRNYSYLGVRGFGPLGNYNSRVLLMIDGVRLNDPIYGQGSIGREFPLDVDMIERVEFVPGPGSAIYGSNAFFGVINVITRNGRGLPGAEASVEAGSLRTGKSRISYGRRWTGNAQLLLSLTAYSSHGGDQAFPAFAVPGVTDGVARGLDWERANDALLKASVGDFTLEAARGLRSKGVPTASFQSVFGDPRERTRDVQSFVALSYESEWTKDTTVSARLNRGRYSYRGDYPYADPAAGTSIVNLDFANSSWWGSEVKVVNRGIEGHKFVAGIEYQRNTRKDQDNYDVAPSATYISEHHKSGQWGLYAQDEYAILETLMLNAGVRHDHYSTFGSITNPRLALIYSPLPSLTFKAMHGRAYRAPNDGELFFSSQPLRWKANPDLKPERISTQELALEWRLASLTRATLSTFHYRISDLITLGTDPADNFQQYRNDGTARVKGAQAEIERLWRNRSSLRATYGYQYAVDQAGERLVNSPRHLAKLDASAPLVADTLLGALSLRYTGARLTRSDARVGASVLADLTLSSESFGRGVQLSASIYNLFNHRNADPVSDAHLQDTILQDGRTFRLKLNVRF
ncbi:MAG TPA: TonB-dependent receptor [Burkholderiaceae bacterium]|nr:TonB-dependent receptor [Burkholderiaceae bacterium]